MLTNHQLGKLFETLYNGRACDFFSITRDDFADLADYYLEDEVRPFKDAIVYDEPNHGNLDGYTVVGGDTDVSIDVTTTGNRVIVSFMASVGMYDMDFVRPDDLSSEPVSSADYVRYMKDDLYDIFKAYVKPFEDDLKALKSKILLESSLKLTRTQAVYDYDEEDAAYFTCIAYFDVV